MLKNSSLKPITVLLLTLVSFSNGRLFQIDGREIFLNGPNIAWNNYGADFGIGSYGHLYDPLWFENAFEDVRLNGGNSVRVWIHCQGEQNPLINGDGYVTGLNSQLIEDLSDMLERAQYHRQLVILTLWDFLIVNLDLINDAEKTRSYINNALVNLVRALEGHDNLLAWEVMNEPQWLWQNRGVPQQNVQRFVAMIAEGIHQVSNKPVTVGSASLKWNSNVSPAVGNAWSRESLTLAHFSEYSYLDFYQVHYYDWMAAYYSPYDAGKDTGFWKLDDIVLIGETGNTGYYSYSDQFENALRNQYAGVMVWAYKSGGAATFDQFKDSMRVFRDSHRGIVDY